MKRSLAGDIGCKSDFKSDRSNIEQLIQYWLIELLIILIFK